MNPEGWLTLAIGMAGMFSAVVAAWIALSTRITRLEVKCEEHDNHILKMRAKIHDDLSPKMQVMIGQIDFIEQRLDKINGWHGK